MSEREALHRAICENPDEDTPRLVFADWLDEHDEPERAEFIRLQIEIAQLPEGKKKQKRQVREKELLDAHKEVWSEPLKPFYASYYSGIYAHHYAPPVVFRRGFVETIAMDATAFIEHGEDVFALSPIRELRQQDCADFAELAKCKHLLRLRSLNLSGSVLSSDGSDSPVLLRSKYLANLTALTARGFDDNGHLDADGLRAIAGSRHLTKLASLDLSNNWILGEHVSSKEETACRTVLKKLGEKLPALRELRLRSVGLSDDHVLELVGQSWVRKLRILDLGSNHLSDAGCRALAESKHLAKLEQLLLTNNDFYDRDQGTSVPLSPATTRMLKKRFGKAVML